MNKGRHSAAIDGDFVVFLIGARFNRWWKLRTWLPVARAMGQMQREILQNPDIGCLHIENFGGRTTLSLQYWRSHEHLERFARSTEWSHLEAWRRFNRLIRDSGDVGIWHETYQVRAGAYEAIYGNMPVFGLGAAGSLVSLNKESTSATRLGARTQNRPPVDAY